MKQEMSRIDLTEAIGLMRATVGNIGVPGLFHR